MNRKQFENYIINDCVLRNHWLVKHNAKSIEELLATDEGEYCNEDVYYHYLTWLAAKRDLRELKQ